MLDMGFENGPTTIVGVVLKEKNLDTRGYRVKQKDRKIISRPIFLVF
jgi:hypothetical protein